MLHSRNHFAWQVQEFVCLGSTFSWQAQYFWSIRWKMAKTYCNSEVMCLANASFLKEVSQKSFVFEILKSLDKQITGVSNQPIFRSCEPQTNWQPNYLNLKSMDSQIIRFSKQLTTNALESQIRWSPNHRNVKSADHQTTWFSSQLATKSLKSQISWCPDHLNLTSVCNQLG